MRCGKLQGSTSCGVQFSTFSQPVCTCVLLRVTAYCLPCRRTHLVESVWLPVSACADQQFGTHTHRSCEAQTPKNNLSVGLRADYLRVQEAHLIDVDWRCGLTYLLTVTCNLCSITVSQVRLVSCTPVQMS